MLDSALVESTWLKRGQRQWQLLLPLVQMAGLCCLASQSTTHKGGPEPRWLAYQQEATGLRLEGLNDLCAKKRETRKNQRHVLQKMKPRSLSQARQGG
jgi:hypothetical protein